LERHAADAASTTGAGVAAGGPSVWSRITGLPDAASWSTSASTSAGIDSVRAVTRRASGGVGSCPRSGGKLARIESNDLKGTFPQQR
jgi:hypothetical protein